MYLQLRGLQYTVNVRDHRVTAENNRDHPPENGTERQLGFQAVAILPWYIHMLQL